MRLTPDQLIDLTPHELQDALKVAKYGEAALARGGVGF